MSFECFSRGNSVYWGANVFLNWYGRLKKFLQGFRKNQDMGCEGACAKELVRCAVARVGEKTFKTCVQTVCA